MHLAYKRLKETARSLLLGFGFAFCWFAGLLPDIVRKRNLPGFHVAFPPGLNPSVNSEPPPLISGEQKSNGGLVHPHLKGFDEPKQVSDTRLLEGLLTVLSFTLFSPGHAVRFPKLSARQRLKPMPIGR